MKRTTFALALGLAASIATPTLSANETSLIDPIRSEIASRADAIGVDPQFILDQPVKLKIWHLDGQRTVQRSTFGELLAAMLPPVPASAAGDGPLGTPEILAGNTTHLFGHLYSGDTDAADCGGITVVDSTTVPETPFVPVTGAPLYLTPVPGALEPVVPSTSWALPAYVAGGPTRHVNGHYNLFGFHQVGTLIGSGASTASGAPNGSPAWLPIVHQGTFISDSDIDFVGQAEVFEARFRSDFDIFGYRFTICGAIGGMLFSDGVAIFDNRPLVMDQSVAFPDIP